LDRLITMNAAIDTLESQLQRTRMVRNQLIARGITDQRVVEAFLAVPREAFIDEGLVDVAYSDAPLPIGHHQTISQPYIVALTIESLVLRGDERVLDVGTGSGYAAAILSRLAETVFTIERIPELAERARAKLAALGFCNVEVTCGDGTLGLKEHAPFDAIAVAASGPAIPPALLDQLAHGGRLVMPVGPNHTQTLMRVTRTGSTFRREAITEVQFVPLIGEQGWKR
jgi:protein-L-isoaspartate(D-aspartate) O-methyltransferase